jgi:hypothetical protein
MVRSGPARDGGGENPNGQRLDSNRSVLLTTARLTWVFATLPAYSAGSS